ncbi:acetylxylan esterase [Dyadobacter sp. CY345]|uniref:acyl-CoA thioester hydrolase/BAAT C-terminal domain-containing protein n=1 Tax=Dyadobacter sp. CY345 TaxID=2909335 RepID=UPI001F29B13D|nr:acyl-CoA thioester hydrolase/BAAT C-terminal domain-containing protein [Dyadobacter sp. CY345]MCF2443313.1 acetylxylan esterase [Dyadobacter sp. CY345]
MMKKIVVILLIGLVSGCGYESPKNSNKVESKLYLGKAEYQPLVVGLGGSEGGNAWTGERWKKTRDRFVNQGYAFLAIGYFGTKGTPEALYRISIDAVYKAIMEAAGNSQVDGKRIAVIGGSKGAELALLLASQYSDIKCVIGLVPAHCAFPALTFGASTSSWTYHGQEVPYVPMPWAAVPSAMRHDFRSAFEIMLEDKEAVEKAVIKIEDINGPILLVSAKKDEWWPSTEMSNFMMIRLKEKKFIYPYQHIAVEGGHTDVLDHFDAVFAFLNSYFPAK